ncbi:Hepatic triacylglycerol lipase, partial [Operophtera brumata]
IAPVDKSKCPFVKDGNDVAFQLFTSLQAGPWYFTAAQNTWYIGRYAGRFIDYLVSRSGSESKYHTFGISPQPGCELEVVIPKQMLLNKFFCSHWRSYQYYTESVIRPIGFKASECPSWKDYTSGACAFGRTIHMGYGADTNIEYKLEKLFNFIQAVRAKINKTDNTVTIDRVKAKLDSLYEFKDDFVDYLNGYDDENYDKPTESSKNYDKRTEDVTDDDFEEIIDDIITKSSENSDETPNEDIKPNFDQLNKTEGDNNKEVFIEDQIAEETDLYTKAKLAEVNIKNNDDILLMNEDTLDVKIRIKRDADLLNHKRDDVELTVVSGNLTLANDDRTNNSEEFKFLKNITSVVKINVKNNVTKQNDTGALNFDTKPTVNNSDDGFELTSDEKDVDLKNATQNMNKDSKSFKFNIFRRRPILRQIIRMIPRINMNYISKDKRPKFNSQRNKVDKIDYKSGKIWSLEPVKANIKKNILKRQKRFSFFQRSEDSNNILFRMLDFLIKNRKNVLPVFTVMREINTLVKSGNGELNHFSRENNNYIGATPPAFTPISYNLELGNENRGPGRVLFDD